MIMATVNQIPIHVNVLAGYGNLVNDEEICQRIQLLYLRHVNKIRWLIERISVRFGERFND